MPFNQTNVELKHFLTMLVSGRCPAFNQTNVELKLNMLRVLWLGGILLIRPMWN